MSKLLFQIMEDDYLPKVLCYRCMYNLENFYDFRTACVNAAVLLERNRPKESVSIRICKCFLENLNFIIKNRI